MAVDKLLNVIGFRMTVLCKSIYYAVIVIWNQDAMTILNGKHYQ